MPPEPPQSVKKGFRIRLAPDTEPFLYVRRGTVSDAYVMKFVFCYTLSYALSACLLNFPNTSSRTFPTLSRVSLHLLAFPVVPLSGSASVPRHQTNKKIPEEGFDKGKKFGREGERRGVWGR